MAASAAASIDPSGATPLDTSVAPYTVGIGSRKSALALAQSEIVVKLLREAWPQHEFRIDAIATMGDKDQQTALHQFNAKSLWTFELEAMLFEGKIDLIVHSCKDIPTQLPPESTIGAILSRSDPRDALVMHPSLPATTQLAALPAGSLIGTSSVRRTAQLRRLYPHLRFESVRGNVGTRLRKLDESTPGSTASISPSGTPLTAAGQPNYVAIILAAAGLLRLDLGGRISQLLSSATGHDGKKGMMHAVGQGALGIQVREGDARAAALLAPLRDTRTSLACFAERALMRALEGGCSVPIGVETEWSDGVNPGETSPAGSGPPPPGSVADVASGVVDARKPLPEGVKLVLRAIVVSVEGDEYIEAEEQRAVTTDEEAERLGMDVAGTLVSKGAGKILEKINLDRNIIEEQGNA